eukprot:scaffold312944_cov33-Tisochrysis_lutea.AAC.1
MRPRASIVQSHARALFHSFHLALRPLPLPPLSSSLVLYALLLLRGSGCADGYAEQSVLSLTSWGSRVPLLSLGNWLVVFALCLMWMWSSSARVTSAQVQVRDLRPFAIRISDFPLLFSIPILREDGRWGGDSGFRPQGESSHEGRESLLNFRSSGP